MKRQSFIDIVTVGALLVAAATACLARAATPRSPAATVFAALDANHDGALSAPEFDAGYADLQRAMALGLRLREQFAAMDGDRSGALDAREFASLLLVRQAGKAAPPLSAFDADGNHALGFAEYVALVQALSPKAPAPKAPVPAGNP